MQSENNASSPLSRTDLLAAALIGIAALVLYIRTLAPSLLWGDPAEFQTLSYTLGMSHSSGYMTQILIGKLFTYLPVGNLAYRANLVSACFGALTVAQVYLIVRLLGGRAAGAAIACMMLAFTPLFWWSALVAESYTTAAGFIAAVWLCVLLWRRTGQWTYLFIAGLVGALGLGIHSTVGMTAASVAVAMVVTARKRSDWLGAAAGGALGFALLFLSFLYLDYNDPPSSIYNTVYRVNLSAFNLEESEFDSPLERFSVIFPIGGVLDYFFTGTPEESQRRLAEYFSFDPAWAYVLVLVGIVTLFKRDWRDALYPLISFLIIWGWAITVEFSVYKDFYAPAVVFQYAWLGLGASVLLNMIDRLFRQNQQALRIVQAGSSILLLLLPVLHARHDLRLAIRSGYTAFVRDMHLYPVFAPDKAIVDATRIINRVEENAIVFTDWDKLYSYVYTAQVVNGNTGISFHEIWFEDGGLSQTTVAYIDANIDHRPIYFNIDVPDLEERYQVERINERLQKISRK